MIIRRSAIGVNIYSEREHFLSVGVNLTTRDRAFVCAAHAIDSEAILEREPNRPLTEPQEEENWWDFCPICNTKMVNQKCKYVCPNPKCNFFMSCSEFDR
jgi:hypothetical protein